jgi:hypothetical protein
MAQQTTLRPSSREHSYWQPGEQHAEGLSATADPEDEPIQDMRQPSEQTLPEGGPGEADDDLSEGAVYPSHAGDYNLLKPACKSSSKQSSQAKEYLAALI